MGAHCDYRQRRQDVQRHWLEAGLEHRTSSAHSRLAAAAPELQLQRSHAYPGAPTPPMLRLCAVRVHLHPVTESQAALIPNSFEQILCFHFCEFYQDLVHHKRSTIYKDVCLRWMYMRREVIFMYSAGMCMCYSLTVTGGGGGGLRDGAGSHRRRRLLLQDAR